MIKHFTLYTRTNCSYCNRAKKLLISKGHKFTELTVPEQADREMIQERVYGAGSTQIIRSVPQIFLNMEYIGDYKNLVNYLDKT